MQFRWELNQGLLTYKIETPPVFVFGNTAREIQVDLNRDGCPYFLEGSWEIYFAVRNPAIFTEEPLADLATFAIVSGDKSGYGGNIDLSTDALEEFMAEAARKDVLIQFTLTIDGDSQSSIAIPAIVQNYTANPSLPIS